MEDKVLLYGGIGKLYKKAIKIKVWETFLRIRENYKTIALS